jgi:hypothetical protein
MLWHSPRNSALSISLVFNHLHTLWRKRESVYPLPFQELAHSFPKQQGGAVALFLSLSFHRNSSVIIGEESKTIESDLHHD